LSSNSGAGRLITAVIGALISLCVVGTAIFHKVAAAKGVTLSHGGPAMLTAAMAGLFGGGLAAVLVLILILRWGRGHRRT
jgi:hypothetical protein